MRYDVVIIGSGFGGSVAALRLVEKGYSVAVLEAGRRFADEEFPRTSWRLRRFLWAPRLGCYGIQRIDVLGGTGGAGGVLVLSGAGLGGGSLVYANTLYEPPPAFFDDPQWRDITDWHDELAPHYDQAKRMLGVTTYPRQTAADRAMLAVAQRMGVGHTFHATPVGVHLGEPGRAVPDPYFGGAGPDRGGCLHCGQCMTGCRHNAKNTLVKNYLHLAERAGAAMFPLTTVTGVRPAPGGGYRVSTVRTGAWLRRRARVVEADQVIFAAGALGTQRLLHRMKAAGHLPRLSSR
ncbi:MAG: FAD-dependent oxidoreductase, partial [Micromonosporaceae bacterium]